MRLAIFSRGYFPAVDSDCQLIARYLHFYSVPPVRLKLPRFGFEVLRDATGWPFPVGIAQPQIIPTLRRQAFLGEPEHQACIGVPAHGVVVELQNVIREGGVRAELAAVSGLADQDAVARLPLLPILGPAEKRFTVEKQQP